MHGLQRIYRDYEITQAEFSRGTGIRESVLTMIINRGTPLENVKGGNLIKMARYLNLTVEELIEQYGY